MTIPTMRWLATFLLCLMMVPGRPAPAAETALLQSLGFSDDGMRYAFIQWGVHDGLGDPYADVFVLDVPNNRWVPGSPVRVRVSEAEVDAIWAATDDPGWWAHERALDEAADVLAEAGIEAANRGIVLVRRTIYDRSAAADTVRFAVHPMSVREYALRLEQREITSDCDYMSRNPRLFTLTLSSLGMPPLILQQDATLPDSRGCALGYRIHDVLLFRTGFDGPASLIVVVAYNLPGFEGDDVRFLAVSARTALLQPF